MIGYLQTPKEEYEEGGHAVEWNLCYDCDAEYPPGETPDDHGAHTVDYYSTDIDGVVDEFIKAGLPVPTLEWT